jgi:6-phosphogluconolactonase
MASDRPQLHISADGEDCANRCMQFILDHLRDTLSRRPFATIALSGGNTPKLLFSKLASSGFDWSKVHFFWVDERCVPPSSGQSNFRLASEIWLGPARVPPANIHRIRGELTPDEAAIGYIEELTRFFKLGSGQLPVFDLIHRGMGADAHTASLFPGEPLIQNRSGIAAAVWVEKMKSHRVTLLPGVLLAAARTVIQAEGEGKAEAVWHVLADAEDFLKYPCQLGARDASKTAWFLDKAAASKLKDASPDT